MPSATPLGPAEPGLEISVLGPHCAPVSEADLRRLFTGSALTEQRLNRLREWPRMLVACGDRVVAAATCQRIEDELLVPDIGICAECGCSERQIIHALLDALETACLAGGSRRIVLSPPRTSLGFMERRGYKTVKASCAGSWIEKVVG